MNRSLEGRAPARTEPPLDRRLRPTAGVWLLIGEALIDLVLLLPRVALAALLAHRRRRAITDLIRSKGRHAA